MSHAFLSPSGSHSWVHCPAYPTVASIFPEDTETEEARLGTAAHWVLEQVLTSHKNGEPAIMYSYLNTEAPNGVMIDKEIIDGVNEAVNTVVEIIGEKTHLWETTYLEMQLDVKRVHAKCWGTADIIIHDVERKKIYVLDFKFGHVYVEAWRNWQLMLYASGALDLWYENDMEAILHLQTLQPRCYTEHRVIPWIIQALELRPYLNIAAHAATIALKENPLACTGNYCTYCPGRHACEAYLRLTEGCLEITCHPQLKVPSPEAVGVELMMLDRATNVLEARRIAMSVIAEKYIREGSQVPGFCIRANEGSLKWDKDKQEVISMSNLIGIDLLKPQELITPTQAIAKGVDKSLVNRYASRKTMSPGLKPFNQLEAIKIFKNGRIL